MSFDPNAAAADDAGIYGLPFSPEEARVVLIPVPWDATTSYRAGTSRGPAAILEASKQVDLRDVELGNSYEVGIAMVDIDPQVEEWNRLARAEAVPIIKAGGVIDGDEALGESLKAVNAASEKVNDWVEAEAAGWLSRDKLVGLVGGDHSSPFGLIRALSKRYAEFGILHIDAHADLRDAYEGFTWSHASIMRNVVDRIDAVTRLVQVGIRDLCDAEIECIEQSEGRIVTHFDADLARRSFEGETWSSQCERIIESLPKSVYLSFDIDGLDPVYCPNTGTPVPGGLSFNQVNYLIGALVRSGRTIIGFDLNEVAPGENDEWDANVGARMLYKMIGWAIKSQQ